jgi:hypothetical protein
MSIPTEPAETGRSKFPTPLVVLLGLAAVIIVALSIQLDQPPLPPPDEKPPASAKARASGPIYPGVDNPVAVPALGAGVQDYEDVIGVVVNGKARAYRLAGMKGKPQDHVVNDLIAGSPTTVAFCDIGRCTRVFTADSKDALKVAVNGMVEGSMVLAIDGRRFYQETGKPIDDHEPSPLIEVKHERMTWGKWKAAHPDTDIYVGRAEEALPPAATGGPKS